MCNRDFIPVKLAAFRLNRLRPRGIGFFYDIKIIYGNHLTGQIGQAETRRTQRCVFLFFAVDPSKIPADRKDGKE
jgi:hypothetical protein